MKYISIGAVMTEGTEHILTVCRGNNKFTLTGDLANVWLAGRLGFAEVEKPTEQQAAQQLIKMGLAVISRGYPMAEYRTLTQCTIVPAERKYPFLGLSGMEKTVLQWLREAGLVLSMAELVYLIDHSEVTSTMRDFESYSVIAVIVNVLPIKAQSLVHFTLKTLP